METVNNIITRTNWTFQLDRSTLLALLVEKPPYDCGGISGCLRMRELGDLLRNVDELNDDRLASWS